MNLRFLRAVLPMLPGPARHRILLGMVAATIVAVLDAVGITLVLPLARLMTSLEADGLPAELEQLGRWTGIGDAGRLAVVLAVAIVSCFVLKGILALVTLRSTLKVALEAEAQMVGRLLHGYMSAPLEFHLHRNSADLQRTLHEATRRVYQEALVASVPALGDQLILLVVAVVLLVVAPVEALAGALFMVGLVRLYRGLTARRAQASSDALVEHGRRSMQYVQQALAAIREVQISGRAQQFADELLAVRQSAAARQHVITMTEMLPRYYLELGIVLGAGLVGTIAFARHPAEEAVALLALFLAAALRLLPSLNRMLVAEARCRTAGPNLARILEDLSEVDHLREGPTRGDETPLAAGEPFRSLDFDGATFTYRGREQPALESVSFSVSAGDRVVFVGRSGSGKTTMLNVLLGFLTPEQGTVRVNGVPLEQRTRTWHQRIAYVPQDVSILDSSIAENVALGRRGDDVDRQAVSKALALVQLDSVVGALPGGMDGEAGERGARLSGGQRQRLGLARALYEQPEVLVLDEATSALDAETEAGILDILDDLGPSTTIVAVAHRINAIQRFDTVVLFDEGRVIAAGSYDEVLATQPSFATLMRSIEEEEDRPAVRAVEASGR